MPEGDPSESPRPAAGVVRAAVGRFVLVELPRAGEEELHSGHLILQDLKIASIFNLFWGGGGGSVGFTTFDKIQIRNNAAKKFWQKFRNNLHD